MQKKHNNKYKEKPFSTNISRKSFGVVFFGHCCF